MALSKAELQQLLERLIFDEDEPDEWVQDIWGLSPTLGESAVKLLEVFRAVVECCPDERLEAVLHSLYDAQME